MTIKQKYATYRKMTIVQLQTELDDISNSMSECEYGDYSYDCLELEYSIAEEVLAEKKIKINA
jgi:hypothetical protein